MTLSNVKLLIVDDEIIFRKNLSKLLLNRGLPSDQVGDGKACLSFLENNRVDVVVLDVKMPVLSGIQVLKQINEKNYPTEIILLTGEATTEDGVEGIKAGAFDYLSKPIEVEHLITKIKQAYNKILLMREHKKEAAFRKKMEQKMMATERLAALGTLAAGVAHEINNPLVGILLYSSNMCKKVPAGGSLEKGLKIIMNETQRCKTIIQGLLNFAHDTEPNKVDADINNIMKSALGIAENEFRPKHVHIDTQLSRTMARTMLDNNQILQVFLNILLNALQSVGKNGRITVKSRVNEEQKKSCC